MRFFSYSAFLGASFIKIAHGVDPFALPHGYHYLASRALGIVWKPCEDDSPYECGRFEVPLDYQNDTTGKASLAVARLRATQPPKLGTLFLNPGGPGESGVEMILKRGKGIMDTAGGKYDVVSWDPRGVERSTPQIGCFQTGAQESKFWNNTIPHTGIEARGNFTDPSDLASFYDQVPQVDFLLKEIGKQCISMSPNTLQYVGTAAAVRDMLSLSDYLEGPNKPVNFWGFSYGTVIGIYFVNMFPDRVGRVVLDGVVDPEIWANRPAHELWNRTIDSADQTFEGFVSACAAAGPSSCAIAPKNPTPASVKQIILQLIDRAYDYRKSVGPAAQLNSADVRHLLYNGLYIPARWPNLARDLKNMSNYLDNPQTSRPPKKRSPARPRTRVHWGHANNESPRSEVSDDRSNANQNNDPPRNDYTFQSITCADAADPANVTTKAVFDSLVDSARTVSPVFGELWGDAGFYCHRWPARAVERFTGPFNKTLSNKILVIGNEADPSTPFSSAKIVADALGDSAVLIKQEGFGHVSLAIISDCTLGALTAYFLNNTLPSAEKRCGSNQVLFPGAIKSRLAVRAAGAKIFNSPWPVPELN
ncbi:Abhydrolase domain-containing protein [Ceratobasidium sp. AG-Ba]|nr:Abhydrolase domain-containing protein [Ceratobasidium sp. AG-Ba]